MTKQLSGWDRDTSPYHAGEQQIHESMGRKEHQETMGRRIHRPFMPDQHREFFAQLPFMVVGSVDQNGWPWASLLFGKPGFAHSPTDKRLVMDAKPVDGDPLAQNWQVGAPIGLLGIELPTRRRNRMNGVVGEYVGDGVAIDVTQSYGNCPQYIQTRSMEWARDPAEPVSLENEHFSSLDDTAKLLITQADTFYVASHNDKDDARDTGGVDVSHRGGQPGFVKVDGDVLTIPDYMGNFAFNTFGNFLVNPKAGLIFMDFETGDLLMLTGTVELILEKTQELATFKGAERGWRFVLDHGLRIKAASPLRWSFGEFSPNSLRTDSWAKAEERQALEAKRHEWLDYRVMRVVDETSSVRSFYLEPADGDEKFSHLPGQFLTVQVHPKNAPKPLSATYTLSSAPDDALYRLSIKRDGIVSQHLHDTIKPGDTIKARAPSGSFVMDTREKRPVVLIAAGIGITPMLAMTRQAVSEGLTHRHTRPLTIIHQTRNVVERLFAEELNQLVAGANGAIRYISILSQPEADTQEGTHYHLQGRLNAEHLQSILRLADYDFFVCGPSGFMQSTYDNLRSLGVNDARIFAESFGPSSLVRQQDAQGAATEMEPTAEAESAVVTFAKSKFEQAWKASEDGTLLDHAEAHGLSPDYGCRSGQCGSCAVRLLSGKVAYRGKPEFKMDDDEVLICCAVPAKDSDEVVLDL